MFLKPEKTFSLPALAAKALASASIGVVIAVLAINWLAFPDCGKGFEQQCFLIGGN